MEGTRTRVRARRMGGDGGAARTNPRARRRVGAAPPCARDGGAQPAPAKGKDGAPNLMQPDNDFYKTFAVECSKQQRCGDVWNCNSGYADVATLAQLAKNTGGSVYHFRGFSDVTMGEKLSRDLQRNLTRVQA